MVLFLFPDSCLPSAHRRRGIAGIMRGIAVLAGAGVGVGVFVSAIGRALQIGYCLGVLVPVPWVSRESCCWGPDPGREISDVPLEGNRVRDWALPTQVQVGVFTPSQGVNCSALLNRKSVPRVSGCDIDHLLDP